MPAFVKPMATLTWFKIEFKCSDALLTRLTDEAGGGIDGARRSNTDKQIGAV